MKRFSVVLCLGLSLSVFAIKPELGGACASVVEVRALPFFTPALNTVLSVASLGKITEVRFAPPSVSSFTLLDRLGEVLLGDPLFKSAYTGAGVEKARPALQRLVGQLLQPQSANYIVLLIALTELELIRNYNAGHMGAMGRMAEIIDSDSYYGEREAAIRKDRGLTLVHQLIVERETQSVADVIKRYYAQARAAESGLPQGNTYGFRQEGQGLSLSR